MERQLGISLVLNAQREDLVLSHGRRIGLPSSSSPPSGEKREREQAVENAFFNIVLAGSRARTNRSRDGFGSAFAPMNPVIQRYKQS
jgi:hypothetical protein